MNKLDYFQLTINVLAFVGAYTILFGGACAILYYLGGKNVKSKTRTTGSIKER